MCKHSASSKNQVEVRPLYTVASCSLESQSDSLTRKCLDDLQLPGIGRYHMGMSHAIEHKLPYLLFGNTKRQPACDALQSHLLEDNSHARTYSYATVHIGDELTLLTS